MGADGHGLTRTNTDRHGRGRMGADRHGRGGCRDRLPSSASVPADPVEALGKASLPFEGVCLGGELAVEQMIADVQ
jgi:hypothetical protein